MVVPEEAVPNQEPEVETAPDLTCSQAVFVGKIDQNCRATGLMDE